MATLTFTSDEALNILRANGMLPAGIREVRADRDGLRLTMAAGIEVLVRQESFADGILRLSYSSTSWAFKLAEKLGKVDAMIDPAIRPYPFLRREGKSLFIDLNQVLQARAKGIQVKNFELHGGIVGIEF
jgi:hypothetical protein